MSADETTNNIIMSAAETGKMSAAETGKMSAAETRQTSPNATGLCPVLIRYISLVPTADICPVSTEDNVIYPVSTEDIMSHNSCRPAAGSRPVSC